MSKSGIRGERPFIIFMLMPAFFFLIMFYIYPTLFNLENSFTDLSLFGLKKGGEWVGIDNYVELVTSSDFRRVLFNTVVWLTIIGVSVRIILGLGLALLLNCRTCRTVVLLRLYQGSIEQVQAHPFVLTSLNCHPEAEDRGRWQIQDFFLTVPVGFALDSSSFQFGVSRLMFKTASAELQFLRLAPASNHLEHSSLADLFQSFCSAPPDRQVTADPYRLRYHQVPTFTQQILSRLKRGRPYQSASFSYFPDHDRILGYSVRSVRPLTGNIESDLHNGYGIVQEKETSGSTDP